MYKILLLLTQILSILGVVHGQSICTAPSGAEGKCISLYDCDALLKIADDPNRTPEQLQTLQRSRCGPRGTTVTVCCPTGCITPDGRLGECVNIYSCPKLASRLRPPVSAQNKRYVQQFKCPSDDPHSVCCSQDITTASTNVANRKSPANNINAICSAQQSSAPPDPKSDCCGFDSRIGNKIIGGNETAVDQYPWLCPIQYDRRSSGESNLLCGGVLISARYVLTAAHCIGRYAIRTFGKPTAVILGEYDTSHTGKDCKEVDAGGMDCTDGEVVIEIEKLIPHPEYSTSSKKNDIGLIKLVRNAPFTEFIRPICLPTYDITLNPPPAENFTLYVAGWGRTEDGKNSDVKLHVGLPYVELNICQRSYHRLEVSLWERQLCAGGQLGKDSCKGDSGGPLMYENGRIFEVLGVVNFGPKPCAQEIPGVYAKVFSYLEWIHSTIAANG